jgi:hypothetical protein
MDVRREELGDMHAVEIAWGPGGGAIARFSDAEAREVQRGLERVLPPTGSNLTPEEAEVARRIAAWVGGHGIWAEGLARGIAEGRWKDGGA